MFDYWAAMSPFPCTGYGCCGIVLPGMTVACAGLGRGLLPIALWFSWEMGVCRGMCSLCA